ncbi:hypothetical protein EDB80DRAFT_682602 [Ilyonectria destructans]|nr:hypothetical protein EDB80DRAFT_682602 [Ilyonectria destructans]
MCSITSFTGFLAALTAGVNAARALLQPQPLLLPRRQPHTSHVQQEASCHKRATPPASFPGVFLPVGTELLISLPVCLPWRMGNLEGGRLGGHLGGVKIGGQETKVKALFVP